MRYAKILSFGDELLKPLFEGTCYIEEKIDGSQFRAWYTNKQWSFGSKSVDYSLESPPDKMFVTAVNSFGERIENVAGEPVDPTFLVMEYLKSKRHNTLDYERFPRGHLVLLDAFEEGTPPRESRAKWAKNLDLETPPLLMECVNRNPTMDEMKALLETISMLGGQKIEGFVAKNYEQRIHVNGKTQPVFGKYVREEFKEMNKENWGQGIALEDRIMSQFAKTPRWEKAVIHLKEQGKLVSSPKDIGMLMEEIQRDFEEEAKLIIMEDLWKHYRHEFVRRARFGFPEWYKEELLKKQLGGE